MAKHCPLQLSETLLDNKGRYLFLKGTCYGKRITLANIYAPNRHQVFFFHAITQALIPFQEGTLILGGDFNISLKFLNPLQDTSNGASSLPYKALRAIKTQLCEIILHDSWLTLNPDGRDFTHTNVTRLDYLFISQKVLPMLYTVSIDPMFLSDHHPISLTLSFPEVPTRPTSWRLDPSLLTDASV